jgi:protein-ribulosamine 3-kinase
MHLPATIATALRELFTRHTDTKPVSLSVRPSTGGCINQGAVVSANGITLFVKWNSASRYPEMFAAEAKGLQLLATVGQACVPGVVEQGENDNLSWLALEYIEPEPPSQSSADHLGHMLATMHRATHHCFGLDHNNYMGSLPQSNCTHDTWAEFYVQERLVPQVRIARDQGALTTSDIRVFDRLNTQIMEIVPDEPPALVHGDLWSGNYLTGSGNTAWLIDPAVAYNHRETDIAMSLLFGGFSQRFYEVYQHHFPLTNGWEDRVGLFQLYPLLVHVNLFGSGYLRSVREVLKDF